MKRVDSLALQAAADLLVGLHDFDVAASTVAQVKVWVDEDPASTRASYALVLEGRRRKPRPSLLSWLAARVETRVELPPPEKPRFGAPRKISPQITAAVVSSILAGNFEQTAAREAGIATSTFQAWMKRGREHREKVNSGTLDLDPSEAPFVDFVEAVEIARAQVEAAFVGHVRKAAEGGATLQETQTEDGTTITKKALPNVAAMTWWLERSFPERWGRHRIEIGGPDSAPIAVEVQVSAVEILAQKIADVAERGAAA